MSASVKKRLLDALEVALRDDPALENVQVERDRALEAQAFPCVLLHSPEVRVDNNFSVYEAMHLMEVHVEGYCTATPGVALSDALDGLQTKVLSVLQRDHTLGGLATDVQVVSVEEEIDKGGDSMPLGAFLIVLEVLFFTDSADVTTAV